MCIVKDMVKNHIVSKLLNIIPVTYYRKSIINYLQDVCLNVSGYHKFCLCLTRSNTQPNDYIYTNLNKNLFPIQLVLLLIG